MKKISIFTTASCIIISLMIGFASGYFFTPAYQLSMYEKESMGLGRTDRWLDLRYVNTMISHHKGAILLAQKAALNSTHPQIQSLAQEIQTNEPNAIRELYTWKSNWYQDNRIVKDPISPNLGKSDDTFDLRFLNALIAHHEEGLLMTKEVRLKSNRTEVLNNADAVEMFLTNSLDMLKKWRKEWYNI